MYESGQRAANHQIHGCICMYLQAQINPRNGRRILFTSGRSDSVGCKIISAEICHSANLTCIEEVSLIFLLLKQSDPFSAELP